MKAKLIRHEKVIDELGNNIEIKMWQLPKPTKDRPHGYKYSLVYIADDERIIGYDNAEGKGEHRHIRERVEPYRFVSIKKLVQDFYSDIERYKGGNHEGKED